MTERNGWPTATLALSGERAVNIRSSLPRGQHECDCDLYEDECTDENVGSGVTWTESCNCPARPAQLGDN